ncbi:DNA polymerase/3'-5' exonuclease PolX [Thermotalea metallivorans]|uniref:DNA polymerase beta n=1 Tax=Thermotalea metallivorans TaxID=520762 RepID=A0A140L2A3_9FIRM|nr:DNA polymerase/3'-5' exonuclease PolX [Thermotalea metallivorans]KXG74678.1 DNA polymerase/3'-5' exonuclease PolX [Thermotalea metallivorans]
MDKYDVSRIFHEIAWMLELLGENPFKAKAYQNGARIIENMEENLETLIKENRVEEIKGIGKTLQEKIQELMTSGKSTYYEELKKQIPPGLFEILKIPGLGPKKVKQLYDVLHIQTVGELEYACLENRLIDLKGFGMKTQEKILKGIENLNKYRGKFLISEAMYYGKAVEDQLKIHPKVIECSMAGSIRRKKEIIKDIDILVSAKDGDRSEIMDAFASLDTVEEILVKGETKSSVKLFSGIQVDLRIVKEEEFPYALHHFTGSKEHNAAMGQRAKAMGFKINEYGLFQGEKKLICKSEEELFHTLGLQFIPPELREDNGEIQAAEAYSLPELIEEKHIKGLFHMHTHYSDGLNSIEEMARMARSMGCSHIGISDHSRSAYYARGLKKEHIEKQHEEIQRLNRAWKDLYILKGIESDILADGSLDYEEEILEQFDYVIASVHSHFHMGKEEMTHRVIKAVENRHTKILGHPTGRLLLSREGYDIDLLQVLKACKTNGVAVEINANPHRLDLDWRFCKMAKALGVKIAIEPDAHAADGLKDVIYGIGIARKGWLEAKDVINTFTLEQIRDFFKK